MKDFDQRNIVKQSIDARVPAFHVKEREFWYVHLGINVGVEENGKGIEFKRPVLVLKKVGSIFVVLPMTTKGKNSMFYYELSACYFGKTSRIILSQIRAVDQSRFISRLSMISREEFVDIKQKLKTLLL